MGKLRDNNLLIYNGLHYVFHSILNDEKIVCILSHLHIQIYSNLRNPTHSALCFLIRFSEEEAEATEDFDMSISRLFKNKITVGTSQLFNNCLFYRTPKCPALDFLSFLKITVYATGDIHM